MSFPFPYVLGVQPVQPAWPCAESRNSVPTLTFSCGANGVTEPARPAPGVRPDFFGAIRDRFRIRCFSLVWQLIQLSSAAAGTGRVTARRIRLAKDRTENRVIAPMEILLC